MKYVGCGELAAYCGFGVGGLLATAGHRTARWTYDGGSGKRKWMCLEYGGKASLLSRQNFATCTKYYGGKAPSDHRNTKHRTPPPLTPSLHRNKHPRSIGDSERIREGSNIRWTRGDVVFTLYAHRGRVGRSRGTQSSDSLFSPCHLATTACQAFGNFSIPILHGSSSMKDPSRATSITCHDIFG
jgi:hypothetical protein